VAAKQILRAFYDQRPRFSYFTGCSDGGHEALMEAQRFPDDYDGIVAGASANYWTHQSAAWVWEARAALDKLIASHTALGFPDNVMAAAPPPGDFSRPLCPWPQAARWTMTGSAKDAGSFVCASPTGNAHEGED